MPEAAGWEGTEVCQQSGSEAAGNGCRISVTHCKEADITESPWSMASEMLWAVKLLDVAGCAYAGLGMAASRREQAKHNHNALDNGQSAWLCITCSLAALACTGQGRDWPLGWLQSAQFPH